MAVTEWYVTKAGNDSTGDGSIGTPWLTMEKAMGAAGIVVTGQGAFGDRINIGAGDYVLTAELAGISSGYLATVTTSSSKPFFLDGGSSSTTALDGDNTYGIIVTTRSYIGVYNLELRNCGSAAIIKLDDRCMIARCKIHGSSAATPIAVDLYGSILDCEIYDITNGIGVSLDDASVLSGCYFHQATGTPGDFWVDTDRGVVAGNIFHISNVWSGVAIQINTASRIFNNSIYSDAASTGAGINFASGSNGSSVIGNLVEGFSGAGGKGIVDFADKTLHILQRNAVYNCTTPYTINGLWGRQDDNETLDASPFVDAANGDFTPVDTGNVKEGGWPSFAVPFGSKQSYPWKGAIQPQAAAAGGGILIGLGTSGGARN